MQADGFEAFVHDPDTRHGHRRVGEVIRQQTDHHRPKPATQQIEPGKEQRHGGCPQPWLDHVLNRGVDAGVKIVGKQPAKAENADKDADLDSSCMQRIACHQRGDQHAEGCKQQPAIGGALVQLVGNPAAQRQADQTGHAHNYPRRHRCFLQRQKEVALQHRHHE